MRVKGTVICQGAVAPPWCRICKTVLCEFLKRIQPALWFVLVLSVLFFSFLNCFFFKCFSNFLVSRLTFSFNFCLLLLHTLLITVTFTNLLLHARLLLLFNKLYVLYVCNYYAYCICVRMFIGGQWFVLCTVTTMLLFPTSAVSSDNSDGVCSHATRQAVNCLRA